MFHKSLLEDKQDWKKIANPSLKQCLAFLEEILLLSNSSNWKRSSWIIRMFSLLVKVNLGTQLLLSTGDHPPIKQSPRRTPFVHSEKIAQLVTSPSCCMYLWLHTRALYSIQPSLGCINYNLTNEEEAQLSSHLLATSQVGFGKIRRDVKYLVETYISKEGDLKGPISDGWWRRFFRAQSNFKSLFR